MSRYSIICYINVRLRATDHDYNLLYLVFILATSFGDELTSRPRRRDDQGDELTSHRLTGLDIVSLERKVLHIHSIVIPKLCDCPDITRVAHTYSTPCHKKNRAIIT